MQTFVAYAAEVVAELAAGHYAWCLSVAYAAEVVAELAAGHFAVHFGTVVVDAPVFEKHALSRVSYTCTLG